MEQLKHDKALDKNQNGLDALNEVNSSKQPSMISFVADLPNITTLLGLLSALLGIYFAMQGLFYYAVIGGAWAVLFDWMDGFIASKMKGRTNDDRAFGAQMDSLIDIVSFGVLPAVILLSYANFNPWYLPGAFAIVGACAIRLSYFNIYGLTGGKMYTGLAVDYNGILVSLAFLAERFLDKAEFSIVLYILIVLIVFLNLSSLQIPKFSKKWIFAIAIYVISITIYLGTLQVN